MLTALASGICGQGRGLLSPPIAAAEDGPGVRITRSFTMLLHSPGAILLNRLRSPRSPV
jgi:hypothetical protein